MAVHLHHVVTRRFRFQLIFISLVLFCSVTMLVLLLEPKGTLNPRKCFTAPTQLDEEQQLIDEEKFKLLDDVLLADVLPVPGRSIFFHDTSCSRLPPAYSIEGIRNLFFEPPHGKNIVHLTSRQACAIESAALHNPNFDIFVMFTQPSYIDNSTSDTSSLVQTILTYPNVHLRNLNLWTYAAGTPVYKLIKDGLAFKSSYVLSHTSDLLRYLSLYHWGGLYLDMDTVTLRSLEDLPPNYTGAESNTSLAAGIMNFAPDNFGHEVATMCLQDLQQNFNGQSWGTNGPGVITRVLKKICNTNHISLMTIEPNNCRGFKVFKRDAFYAIHWEKWDHFFNPDKLNSTLLITQNSYVLHVWNNYSKHRILKLDSKSAYTELARKHCPRVYESLRDAGRYF